MKNDNESQVIIQVFFFLVIALNKFHLFLLLIHQILE